MPAKFEAIKMSVDGREGWAIQKTENGEVTYLAREGRTVVQAHRTAEADVGSFAKYGLHLLLHGESWLERQGARNGTAKPMSMFPPSRAYKPAHGGYPDSRDDDGMSFTGAGMQQRINATYGDPYGAIA